MTDNGPVLATENLTKRYGEFTALEDLTIQLDRGHILGFIGPNGAGKTTTIKILVGLARPTTGTARIAGADCVRDARRIKRLVGYMPDQFGSYDNMRVHEYLDFFGAAYGIGRRKRKQRIAEVLELTHGEYMRDRFVETLSHGMQQRIGIARTLLHDPEVLILDEPANGLDPQARIEMRELLLRLAAMGKTLIVTSHILPELSRICDVVAIIHQGRLRAFGALDEITRKLHQQRMVEVQLDSAEDIDQAAALAREYVATQTEVAVSQAESTVRFRTERSEKELGALLAGLVNAGVVVTQFRELAGDLEDAFLTVTRADDPESPPSLEETSPVEAVAATTSASSEAKS